MISVFGGRVADAVLYPFRLQDLMTTYRKSACQASLKDDLSLTRRRILNRQLCSMVTHEALLDVLSFHLDARLCEKDLVRDDFGKIFVKGSKILFNVSHTNAWVYIVVSRYPIGIDIERHRALRSRAAFSNYLSALTGERKSSHENRPVNIARVWCQAEAVMKCIGTGMVTPLDVINLCADMSGEQVRIDTKYGPVWITEVPHPVDCSAYMAATHFLSACDIVCNETIQGLLHGRRGRQSTFFSFLPAAVKMPRNDVVRDDATFQQCET